jgi:hypothetical protein
MVIIDQSEAQIVFSGSDGPLTMLRVEVPDRREG